jgi:hypothetical protein
LLINFLAYFFAAKKTTQDAGTALKDLILLGLMKTYDVSKELLFGSFTNF